MRFPLSGDIPTMSWIVPEFLGYFKKEVMLRRKTEYPAVSTRLSKQMHRGG
jgi:hypothetical protein